MSDEVLTIKLTMREIDLIHQCIGTNVETVKRRHDPNDPMIAELLTELGELSDDLLEQRFNPEDPDLFMDPVDFAAKHDTDLPALKFVEPGTMKAGSDAATSRAAERRNFNLKGPDPKLSKTQTHDVWAKPPNDPADW
jgi:hypothetical protein